uniref:Secreted protein n=1 Tax=Physcomitrium patens TaxID=3218 RepID=A0A2K1JY08_PHYPA|nr:hypothetical protein PHYPA_013526 [Physcomitrium patens]
MALQVLCLCVCLTDCLFNMVRLCSVAAMWVVGTKIRRRKIEIEEEEGEEEWESNFSHMGTHLTNRAWCEWQWHLSVWWQICMCVCVCVTVCVYRP